MFVRIPGMLFGAELVDLPDDWADYEAQEVCSKYWAERGAAFDPLSSDDQEETDTIPHLFVKKGLWGGEIIRG